MEQKKTEIEERVFYVEHELNKELCTILAGKMNSANGRNDIVKDVVALRVSDKDRIMDTKDALRLILETAHEIKQVNRYGREHYNLG